MTSIRDFVDDPSIQTFLFLALAVAPGGAAVKGVAKGVKKMLDGQRAHVQLTSAYKAMHGDLPGVRYNKRSLFSLRRPDIVDLHNQAVPDFKMITTDKDLIARYERQLFQYMEDNGVENGTIVWYRMENGVAVIVHGP